MRSVRAGFVVLGCVLAAACATDPVPSPSAAPTASPLVSASPLPVVPTPEPTSSVAASPTPPPSTLPPGVDQVVRITVASGKVSGVPKRLTVAKGKVVQLVVTSDVADEVHLHTYDVRVDVAAGGTATLQFTASIAGVFDLELEDARLSLTKIQVQ